MPFKTSLFADRMEFDKSDQNSSHKNLPGPGSVGDSRECEEFVFWSRWSVVELARERGTVNRGAQLRTTGSCRRRQKPQNFGK